MTDCLREDTALALVQGELMSRDAEVIHTHIDHCEPCRQLIVVLARTPRTRRSLSSDVTHATGELAPLCIADRYELGGVLGAGAMGIVYEARDRKLARIVALKRVKHEHVDAHERLVREALTMAQLSHPGVVSVFDAGIADGGAYVAMEYVAGETLRTWLGWKRPWRSVIELFVQAARGLEAAHAAGIVHGDFKPDNVLVDPQGRARVADFGLARTISDLTRARDGGTPAYMAPELLAGGPSNQASDQYAWAISLYEAIHGKRPYSASTVDELRVEQTRALPKRRGVPSALARIVDRGLAIDPARRFPSMAAAATALAAVPGRRARRVFALAVGGVAIASGAIAWMARGDAALPACTDGGQELADVWGPERAARMKTAFAARPELGEALVSTLNAYGERWRVERKAACEATRAGEQSGELLDRKLWCLDQRRESLREVTGVIAALAPAELDKAMPIVLGLPALDRCRDRGAMLAQPALPESADARKTLRALDAELQRADAETNAGHFDSARARYEKVAAGAATIAWAPLEAQAWMSIGHLELTLNRTKAGDDALGKAIDAASRARDDRLVADTLIKMLVAVLVTTVQTSEAERMIKLADAAVTRAGDDPLLRANFHQAAGHMLYLRHERKQGAQHYDRALAIYERLPGDHRDPIARLRTGRAAEAIDENDLTRAMAELDKAREAIGEPLERSPNASSYLNVLCMARMFLQQHDQARADCTRARDLFASRLGPDHPDTAAAEGNLGSALLRQGRGVEALAHLEHSFALTAAAYGPQHPQTTSSRKGLADALGQLGQHARARDHWKEILAVHEQVLGKDHPKVAETMTLFAGEEIATGDREAGVKRLEQALPLLEKHLGRTHNMTVTAINSLATAYSQMGRRTEAIATFERAKALLIEGAGPDDLNVGLITFNLAELAREANKPAEALAQYDEVDRIWSKGLPPTHALFAHLHTARGEALIALRRGADAIAALERALPIRSTAGDEVATAQTELALAESLLLARRDRPRARSLVESASKRLAAAGAPGEQWRARTERLRKAAR